MFYNAARDRTLLQLLLDADWQKRQGTEQTLTELQASVTDPSNFAHADKEDNHSNVRRRYEVCLQSTKEKFDGRLLECSTV